MLCRRDAEIRKDNRGPKTDLWGRHDALEMPEMDAWCALEARPRRRGFWEPAGCSGICLKPIIA